VPNLVKLQSADKHPSQLSQATDFYRKEHWISGKPVARQTNKAKYVGPIIDLVGRGGPCSTLLPRQYRDKETGLYCNYHRYYDSKVGAYINQYPIGLNNKINLCKYVIANPLTGINPRGLISDGEYTGHMKTGWNKINRLFSLASYTLKKSIENAPTRIKQSAPYTSATSGLSCLKRINPVKCACLAISLRLTRIQIRQCSVLYA
jgi:RHS repeat-associated protein